MVGFYRILLFCLYSAPISSGFAVRPPTNHVPTTTATTSSSCCTYYSAAGTTPLMASSSNSRESPSSGMERRSLLHRALTSVLPGAAITTTALLLVDPSSSTTCTTAWAASFTAGGTLVDRDVGVQVGNPEASASRKADNSNVIFDKDHYFKFGVAAPWIEPGSTDFPKSVPFAPSQQRYDALKKYGSRVRNGVQFLQSLEAPIIQSATATATATTDFASIVPDPAATPEYALRPMGLLANSFLASENTGTTNELFLARWYVNEIYLLLGDLRAASTPAEAAKLYSAVRKATNSYLGLLNRVVNSKVGDPFELLPPSS